jgi:hypothetical protein
MNALIAFYDISHDHHLQLMNEHGKNVTFGYYVADKISIKDVYSVDKHFTKHLEILHSTIT